VAKWYLRATYELPEGSEVCLRGERSDMNNRCANLACVCEVAMLGDTCTDYCKSVGAADPSAVRCLCGHDACAAEMKEEMTAEAQP